MCVEALTDQAADNPGDGLAIEFSRIGAPETTIERSLEQRGFVDVAEHFLDGGACGVGIDSQQLKLLEYAPTAAALDARAGSRGGKSNPPIVQ